MTKYAQLENIVKYNGFYYDIHMYVHVHTHICIFTHTHICHFVMLICHHPPLSPQGANLALTIFCIIVFWRNYG